MCGFGGVINHYKTLNTAEVGYLASKVNFRGPDSCGIRVLDALLNKTDAGTTAVFFNRLAIVDLDSRSNQPFEDECHMLVFNGEIYNYKELKITLEKEGARFTTTSDTEVLFFALKIWGRNALPKLNGMFAFFWLDKRNRTFMVCRDRLGIKPLYYHCNGNGFYFSSELHSIVRMLNKKPAISTASVQKYLWMQFIPTPYSILENIYKLPPGSFISSSVDNISAGIHSEIYWNAYEFAASSDKKQNDSIEEVLKDSVQRQLQADVPIGLFLSSGVDSSLLAAIVNKHFAKDQEVNFFTVGFSEQTSNDESMDAADFINGFKNPNLKNHLLQVDANFLKTHINDLYNFYDEPFGDYASLLNWVISVKAKEYVTVAISGDGADELFWGYSRYNKWQNIKKLNTFPAVSSAIFKMTQLLPPTSLKDKLQKVFRNDPVQAHFDLFLPPQFRSFLDKSTIDNDIWALDGIERIKNRKDLTSLLDIKTYLADAMLYKVDRSSMATSLEVRVPYLDNKVLEFALNASFEQKSNTRYRNKAILKDLLVKLAPQYNADQPKKGFSFPLKKWLKENWKEQVIDIVNTNVLIEMGLEPKPLLSVISDFYSKDNDSAIEVWRLFNLALWKQNYDSIKDQTFE